jgi:hypothetical protein
MKGVLARKHQRPAGNWFPNIDDRHSLINATFVFLNYSRQDVFVGNFIKRRKSIITTGKSTLKQCLRHRYSHLDSRFPV